MQAIAAAVDEQRVHMSDSTNVMYAFDIVFCHKDAEAVNCGSYFAEFSEEEEAIDTFGTLGSAGTLGG